MNQSCSCHFANQLLWKAGGRSLKGSVLSEKIGIISACHSDPAERATFFQNTLPLLQHAGTVSCSDGRVSALSFAVTVTCFETKVYEVPTGFSKALGGRRLERPKQQGEEPAWTPGEGGPPGEQGSAGLEKGVGGLTSCPGKEVRSSDPQATPAAALSRRVPQPSPALLSGTGRSRGHECAKTERAQSCLH